MSGPPLHAALAQLAAPELKFVRGEPPDSTYVFKHAPVQDAAYATLVRCKRQQLHGRTAGALENGFPETVETQPELLAHHLIQAGLTERAINYLRKAGQRTIERSANAEAVRHLTTAIELLQSRSEGPVGASVLCYLSGALWHLGCRPSVAGRSRCGETCGGAFPSAHARLHDLPCQRHDRHFPALLGEYTILSELGRRTLQRAWVIALDGLWPHSRGVGRDNSR
jgi:hypothetical protein